MTTDKNTVDAQLLAIEVMKAEFLRFFNGSVAQSPDELKARHERINTALADCGGLDGYWVSWLFNELEQRALEELRKLVLLAQTTDPDLLKDKYFNDLPAPLVSNIKALHAHLKGKGASILGNNAKSTKKTALENEIEYRANFF
ncbi:hypothetical protein [Methylobacter sp.]|uniref:hypothetical protein n=1 Tax=Methylobacter sp. TaxID=2051955 RepID=UPI002FDDD902